MIEIRQHLNWRCYAGVGIYELPKYLLLLNENDQPFVEEIQDQLFAQMMGWTE